MNERVRAILDFHETRSFGTGENMHAHQTDARNAYRSLTPAEEAELATAAISRIEKGDQDKDVVLCCLACFRPGSLASVHERLVEQRIPYPGVIYWGATSEVARRLILLCDEDDHRNHALEALAWIGDPVVVETFARWRDKPPDWVSQLYVPPHRYSEEAGWELTADGRRRDLFSPSAYPLVRHEPALDVLTAVQVGVPSAHPCPWCGKSLIVMLDFQTSEALLCNQGSARIRVLTCHVCTSFGCIFGKCAPAGVPTWHVANEKPSYLPPDASDMGWGWGDSPVTIALTGKTRHFLEAANWSMLPGVAFSQIGGLPTWIDDADYPACPECSEKMPFIGQVSNEDFIEHSEGIYYTFRCPNCLVTATTYQQT